MANWEYFGIRKDQERAILWCFFAQKVRRKFAGSPTFVILTDREELNTQISDTFENCGLLGKTKATQFIATSGDDLVQKLKGNPSFIFTLIQKFNEPNAERYILIMILLLCLTKRTVVSMVSLQII